MNVILSSESRIERGILMILLNPFSSEVIAARAHINPRLAKLAFLILSFAHYIKLDLSSKPLSGIF